MLESQATAAGMERRCRMFRYLAKLPFVYEMFYIQGTASASVRMGQAQEGRAFTRPPPGSC